VYTCEKWWKLAGSRQSYCKNYLAYFFWPTLYIATCITFVVCQSGLEAKILYVSASNFSLGLGLVHLASAWPRSAAEEPAAKRRQTGLFANCMTSHNAAAVLSWCSIGTTSLLHLCHQQWILQPNSHISIFRQTQPWLSTAAAPLQYRVFCVPASSPPVEIDRAFSQTEWEIKVCHFDHDSIISAVCCQSSLGTFYS